MKLLNVQSFVRIRSFLLVSASILMAGVAFAGYIWPVASPHPLMATYGQYRPPDIVVNQPYLHPGIDILKSAGTLVTAIDSGLVVQVDMPARGDTSTLRWRSCAVSVAYWGSEDAWRYGHLDSTYLLNGGPGGTPKWTNGDTVRKGDTIGFVVNYSPFGDDHLELAYFHGGGHPGFYIVPPPNWPTDYFVINPLDILNPDSTDAQPPNVSRYKIYPRPDESDGRSAYRLQRFPNGDSAFVVDHKADILSNIYDRYGGGSTPYVGVYKAHYYINGKGVQAYRGFFFRDTIALPEDAQIGAISQKVYDTTKTRNDPYYYIVSNTNEVDPWNFTDSTHFKGYWNSKQLQNSPDSVDATSNAEAEFPDGWYWIEVKAEDKVVYIVRDSAKVIVNNFPPQVKQCHPDSGESNVPQNDSVLVWFDQPMDTFSVKKAFQLRLKGTTDSTAGTKRFKGDTLFIFKPADTLRRDTTYEIFITATSPDSCKDIADSTLDGNRNGTSQGSPTDDIHYFFSTRKRVFYISQMDSSGATNRIIVIDTTGARLRSFAPLDYNVLGVNREKMAADKLGVSYVARHYLDAGSDYVAKYDTAGSLVRQLLPDSGMSSLALDGDYLYAIPWALGQNGNNDWIYKSDTAGSYVTSWMIPASDTFYVQLTSLDWAAGQGYVFAVGKRMYAGPRYGFQVYKYTTSGTLTDSLVDINSSRNLDNVYLQIACTGSRVFVGGIGDPWPLTGMDGDTVFTYDLALNRIGTFTCSGSPPYGGSPSGLWSMDVDVNHIYFLNQTKLGTGSYNWIAAYRHDGTHIWSLPLDSVGDPRYFRSLAVYPSILGTPGMSGSGGGGGIGDGGPQTAETNSLFPKVYALGQSIPNPANGTLRIDYALPKESQVSLRVYNVMGQLVRTLREGKEKPGFYKAEWDGKDQQGRRVSSGVYLYRMEAGEFRKTRKLVVVR